VSLHKEFDGGRRRTSREDHHQRRHREGKYHRDQPEGQAGDIGADLLRGDEGFDGRDLDPQAQQPQYAAAEKGAKRKDRLLRVGTLAEPDQHTARKQQLHADRRQGGHPQKNEQSQSTNDLKRPAWHNIFHPEKSVSCSVQKGGAEMRTLKNAMFLQCSL